MPHLNRPSEPRRSPSAARRTLVLLGLALSVALAGCGGDAGEQSSQIASAGVDTHAGHAGGAAGGALVTARLPDSALVATVYKTPTCGCCQAWVNHLTASGFRVTTVDREDLAPIKAQHGVGEHLASCHTAVIGGYVVEGHVPAADIVRLLKERPAIAGITAPGMPSGSPGMEMPGAPADRYDVVSFDRAGATRVFASH